MPQRMDERGQRGQRVAARRPGGDARRGSPRPRWTAGGGWPRAGLGIDACCSPNTSSTLPRMGGWPRAGLGIDAWVFGVVLVLAAALAGSPALAQDLRFSGGAAALPLRSADPASPVLGRAGPVTASASFGTYALSGGSTLIPGATSTTVSLGPVGGWWRVRPTGLAASRRSEMENWVTVLATRLNAAADGLFTSSQTRSSWK